MPILISTQPARFFPELVHIRLDCWEVNFWGMNWWGWFYGYFDNQPTLSEHLDVEDGS